VPFVFKGQIVSGLAEKSWSTRPRYCGVGAGLYQHSSYVIVPVYDRQHQCAQRIFRRDVEAGPAIDEKPDRFTAAAPGCQHQSGLSVLVAAVDIDAFPGKPLKLLYVL
jgi:hypothetical protein